MSRTDLIGLLAVVPFLLVPSCGPSYTIGPTKTRQAIVYTQWPFDAKEAVRRQDETANTLGIPKELVLDLGNGVTMKLVLIPAGTFVMGSPANEEGRFDEETQHEVEISKPFYMGICGRVIPPPAKRNKSNGAWTSQPWHRAYCTNYLRPNRMP